MDGLKMKTGPGGVAQLGEWLPSAGHFEFQSQSCMEPGRVASQHSECGQGSQDEGEVGAA